MPSAPGFIAAMLKLFPFCKQGADVNGGNHEHDYTTLHFASLAGKVDICKILLQNGVKIDRTNSVKRTAGAFLRGFLHFFTIPLEK